MGSRWRGRTQGTLGGRSGPPMRTFPRPTDSRWRGHMRGTPGGHSGPRLRMSTRPMGIHLRGPVAGNAGVRFWQLAGTRPRGSLLWPSTPVGGAGGRGPGRTIACTRALRLLAGRCRARRKRCAHRARLGGRRVQGARQYVCRVPEILVDCCLYSILQETTRSLRGEGNRAVLAITSKPSKGRDVRGRAKEGTRHPTGPRRRCRHLLPHLVRSCSAEILPPPRSRQWLLLRHIPILSARRRVA